MSLLVCDGQDNRFFSVHPVQEAVRKAMDETSVDIQLYDRPTLGMLRNINNRGIDLVQEVKSQTGSLQLIVLCGIEHFLLGGLQKADRFHLIRARTLQMASSADRAEILPSLYA